jgi:endonuclease YncB( thermonuclease family)
MLKIIAEFVGTSYDRKVANVSVNGKLVMVELAKSGAALPYSTYKSSKEDWGDILDSAKTAKIAEIGAYEKPVDAPGWEFRSPKLGKIRVVK